MEYREKFWARYASVVQHLREPLNLAMTDHWSRPFEYWMRGWLPPAKDAAIVDIACGAGNMLRYFTRLGFTNVSGVDISPPQVELARAIHPHVEVADALEFLRENPGRFDLILGFDVVEHLTKDELLVFTERALAALRPRGRIILQTPNGASPLVGEYRYGDFTHELCLTPKSLGQVLAIAGFGDYEAREVAPTPYRFSSAVRMVLWKLIRLRWILDNMIEVGSPGPGIFTKNFIASARRPA